MTSLCLEGELACPSDSCKVRLLVQLNYTSNFHEAESIEYSAQPGSMVISTYVSLEVAAQGFFSKFLMGGLKIFGPHRSPTGTKSDGGRGLTKKIRLKPKLPT